MAIANLLYMQFWPAKRTKV